MVAGRPRLGFLCDEIVQLFDSASFCRPIFYVLLRPKAGQLEHADAGGNALQRRPNNVAVGAAGGIIIGQDHHIGAE